MSLLEPLTVWQTPSPKRRFGRANDGGYVLCELGVAYDCFLSGGISDDNSFERHVLDAYPGLTCEAFDPHSDGGPNPHPRLHFHREPVGFAGLHDAANALVKLDIEGDEWTWLEYISDLSLSHVAQLVLELHSPHGPRWSWRSLRRLAESHRLVHFHANNWDGITTLSDGSRCPGTCETTWVRKNLLTGWSLNRDPIPSPIDMPNNPSIADHVIDWPPFVNSGVE